jgi:rhodanese-related sulfurtransferase
MAPGAVAFSWLGHAGQGALAGDASATRYGLYALGLLAVIAFVPRLIKQMRQSRIAWIEANELQKQMKSGAAPAILDVRGPDEFIGELGHIPGAVNIPVGDIANRLIEIKALGDKPVIMVCKTDKRSARAAEFLRDENFADVRVLRGGMERWNQDGLQVRGGALET